MGGGWKGHCTRVPLTIDGLLLFLLVLFLLFVKTFSVWYLEEEKKTEAIPTKPVLSLSFFLLFLLSVNYPLARAWSHLPGHALKGGGGLIYRQNFLGDCKFSESG